MHNPKMIKGECDCDIIPYFYDNDMVIAYVIVSNNTTVGYLWFYGNPDGNDYEQTQTAWGLSTVCGYSLSLDYVDKINTIFSGIN